MNTPMELVTRLDADIRSYEPSDLVVCNELVGVEVEMENILNRIPSRDLPKLKYWSPTEDGSLREGGIEYIFRQPLSGKDLVLAIRELDASFKRLEVLPSFSERTSVHVHMDIRNLLFSQFVNLVVLSTMFEKPLFRFAGPGRERNLFCLSVDEAESDIISLGQSLSAKAAEDVHMILNSAGKYAACNISSIFRHGSLEFRHHEGTMDPKQILDWVNILLSLKRYAMSQEELPTINSLRKISEDGIEIFIRTVFGKYADQLMYPNIEHDVINGIRQAQDIIFGSDMSKNISKPSLDYYSPESAFMKYLENKYPDRFAAYMKKDGSPANSPDEEMVRILESLGIQIV